MGIEKIFSLRYGEVMKPDDAIRELGDVLGWDDEKIHKEMPLLKNSVYVMFYNVDVKKLQVKYLTTSGDTKFSEHVLLEI